LLLEGASTAAEASNNARARLQAAEQRRDGAAAALADAAQTAG
jgi:hypothetical protein